VNRKLLAAQVVASALALLVVYLTLLMPDNDGPLFGVKAPGDGAQRHAGAHQHARGGKANRVHRRAQARPVLVPSGPAGPAAVPIVQTPHAPSANQYTDTLSELRARIASG
jgi:hypothetical protein